MFLNFLSMEHMSGAIKKLVPEQLPKSLLVVGSGAIGSEFASLYQDLGCQVTLIDLAKQILPTEDAEVAQFVENNLNKKV